MGKKGLGEQELALLQDLAEKGPASVAEAAERFGAPRDLARSTVLTMMERLREKGYLRRRRDGGSYRYTSSLSPTELLRGVVRRFVEGSLAGSVKPFVSYLADSGDVSDEELAELERLVSRLRSKRTEEKP